MADTNETAGTGAPEGATVAPTEKAAKDVFNQVHAHVKQEAHKQAELLAAKKEIFGDKFTEEQVAGASGEVKTKYDDAVKKITEKYKPEFDKIIQNVGDNAEAKATFAHLTKGENLETLLKNFGDRNFMGKVADMAARKSGVIAGVSAVAAAGAYALSSKKAPEATADGTEQPEKKSGITFGKVAATALGAFALAAAIEKGTGWVKSVQASKRFAGIEGLAKA